MNQATITNKGNNTGRPLFHHYLFLITVLHFLLPSVAGSAEIERLFWDKLPIGITLPVGRERLVTFPGDVRVGMPSELSGKVRTQSHNGTVYWLANESFEAQRIEIHETDGSGIYLVDLSASQEQGIPVNPIEVLNKRPHGVEKTDSDRNRRNARAPRKAQKAPGLVTLTRFAAQQLYAPSRMLKASPSIHRGVVTRRALHNLIRGESIEALPVASWQGGELYVTAVQLRNTGTAPVELDPRRIRGRWKAATFQHGRLHPAGSEADTTAVYLVSDRPFHEMIRGM
ncbi:MAG: TIGR03749 family integrating conjugative element protein [Gammaproteobacteria bacterium HGW-Gammaproteobacteria-10]|nr:MAG: TIGR03749 family integrating conjugative element protein [Gammaproteobacteria bacterium HGW-Gammaproteobacteria-10]